MSVTIVLTVRGMTCGHCVSAVTTELLHVPGVESVDIELTAGGDSPVSIAATQPISHESLAAAVEEAGYEVVEVSS